MDKNYSDSWFSMSIGKSFLWSFTAVMVGLSLVGFLIEAFFGDAFHLENPGGIFLLILILNFLVGPLIYNRKKSRFENHRVLIRKYDGMGVIQGLWGAFFRILVYHEGIELRAFYHRHFIPYDKIIHVSIEPEYLGLRLNIVSGIEGVPDHVTSSGSAFLSLAHAIEDKFKSNIKCHEGKRDDQTAASPNPRK